jgi:hypothetical protein
MAAEATIMNTNVSFLLEKWKEIEHKSVEDDSKPAAESPKKASGNVFKFLQQKQKQVKEEEDKDPDIPKLDVPLPAPPAVPSSGTDSPKVGAKSVRVLPLEMNF